MPVVDNIHSAIAVVGGQGKAFTVDDVAFFAELEGQSVVVQEVIEGTPSLIRLSLDNGEVSKSQGYVQRRHVDRWWFECMPRWASKSLDCVTSQQLAQVMSFALHSTPLPRNLDEALLAHARKIAMVADGCIPGMYVFPWAVFLRNHPHLVALYREYSSDKLTEVFFYGSADREVASLLRSLKYRDSVIIQKRFGLGGYAKSTLEEIGADLAITRERVRQIQKRGLIALRRPSAMRKAFRGFAANFMQRGGSLLVQGPSDALLAEILGLRTTGIQPLGVTMLADPSDVDVYLRALLNGRVYLESLSSQEEQHLLRKLPFLSISDYEKLLLFEQDVLAYHCSELTRPEILYITLRRLGRAAHYTEIAARCNALFPERQNSTRNWHAALCTQGSESLGIVYVGKHGTYGLIEHGYSKPAEGLYGSIERIVAFKCQETGRPVPLDTIISELSKERKEFNLSSVPMVLYFSKKIAAAKGGYIPALTSLPPVQYGIDPAFRSFSSDVDC